MTVTFTITATHEELAATPWTVTCGCPGVTPRVFPTGAQAWEWLEVRAGTRPEQRAPLPGCTDEMCLDYSLQSEPADSVLASGVNLANANARSILSLLGLLTVEGEGIDRDPVVTVELVGACDAEDFLGRVLLAEALAPADAGVPTYAEGNVVYGGRSEGYTQARRADLRTLAERAVAARRSIGWA